MVGNRGRDPPAPGTAHSWWIMLRALGVIFLLVICMATAPWGLLVGAVLCLGWFANNARLFSKPSQPRPSDIYRPRYNSTDQPLDAIPLVNAVYCANCDLITNSRHDDCDVCGSRSVIAVSRIWQLNTSEATAKAARYKVSFIADVRGIPANELSESTRLLNRLADLGGDVRAFHIQVDTVSAEPVIDETEVPARKPPTAISDWKQAHRRAS